MQRCYHCFHEWEGEPGICPHCGQAPSPRSSNCLPRGAVLRDKGEPRYIIGEVCGGGGFGIAYKAWDKTLRTVVVIKEYFPNGAVNRIPGTETVVALSGNRREEVSLGIAHFIEEAKTTARYDSPNIVRVYNYVEANRTAYIVMEYMDGIPLHKFLAQGEEQKLDAETAQTIILAVCEALKIVHKDGVIHRDVSPDNIFLLSGTDRVKLFDFGASRLTLNAENDIIPVIKPGYAPPEQYDAVSKQGPYTDIYALGATLYKLLTGVTPPESTVRKLSGDDMPSPIELEPSVPQYLSDAVMRAMAIDPSLRFQRVQDFERVLIRKKPTGTVAQYAKRRRLVRIASISAAFVLLAGAGGAIGWQWHNVWTQGAVPAGAFTVWYPDSLSQEGMESVAAAFAETYQGSEPELTAIPASEYAARLLEAQEEGTLPALFIATDAVTGTQKVDDVLEAAAEECPLLLEHEKELRREKRVPAGFTAQVFYLNTTLCTFDGAQVSALDDLNVTAYAVDPDCREAFGEMYGTDYETAAPEQFYGGMVSVYYADTSDYFYVQSALPARYRLAAPAKAQTAFTDYWSIGGGTKNERRAAQGFLQYLLTDSAQDYLYIRSRSGALPVNAGALSVYENVYPEIAEILGD